MPLVVCVYLCAFVHSLVSSIPFIFCVCSPTPPAYSVTPSLLASLFMRHSIKYPFHQKEFKRNTVIKKMHMKVSVQCPMCKTTSATVLTHDPKRALVTCHLPHLEGEKSERSLAKRVKFGASWSVCLIVKSCLGANIALSGASLLFDTLFAREQSFALNSLGEL